MKNTEMEEVKQYCHICEKNGSYVRCEHCDEVFCEDCSAVYSENNQIDYNCCKVCAKYANERGGE